MRILQRIKSDLSVPIGCLAALCFSYVLFLVFHDFPDNPRVEGTYRFGTCFILSWWLWHDARTLHFVLPMSYGFLVLFAAPVYAPIYLFQTRGLLAIVTIALYVLLLTLPAVCLLLLIPGNP